MPQRTDDRSDVHYGRRSSSYPRAASTHQTESRIKYTGQKMQLSALWDGSNLSFREFRFGIVSQVDLLNVPADKQVNVLGQGLTGPAHNVYYTYCAAKLDRGEGYGLLSDALQHLEATFLIPMEGLRGRRQLEQLRLLEQTAVAMQTFTSLTSLRM